MLAASATRYIILPLNRYGFFESFREQIEPPSRVEILVHLEDNDVVICKSSATNQAGDADNVADVRYLITKLVLRVPRFTHNAASTSAFDFMKPREWSYPSEHVDSMDLKVTSDSSRISAGIDKPRHVFVCFVSTRKFGDQKSNPLHDTYHIGSADNGAEGRTHPTEAFNPNEEVNNNKLKTPEADSICE